MADERFDGLFMTAVQQAQGIDNFFDALFSFMRRKTDLFSQENQCLTMVNQHLTKHLQLFKNNVEQQKAIAKKRAEEKAKREAEEAAKKAAQAKADEACQIEEVTAEEAELIEREEAAKKANPAAAEQIAKEAEANEENKEDDKDKGADPNSGNGGSTDLYTWEQTLHEVTVHIKIPEGTTAKMLAVDMTKSKLKVGIKGKPPMIEKNFSKPILVDDSLWCIETDKSGKKVLQLSLTKREGQNWWDCVLEGDEKINTQKVEPENSKLADLDTETRGVVEKMMFD